MEERERQRARQILTDYLVATKYRRTPERYAILDAICDIEGEFSIDELGNLLEQKRFRVSRATLYNTIGLFLDLHLVVRHSVHNNTRYSAAIHSVPCFQQICSKCGRVRDVESPQVMAAIDETKFWRFRKEYITIFVYGICSSCLAHITRKRGKQNQNKQGKK